MTYLEQVSKGQNSDFGQGNVGIKFLQATHNSVQPRRSHEHALAYDLRQASPEVTRVVSHERSQAVLASPKMSALSVGRLKVIDDFDKQIKIEDEGYQTTGTVRRRNHSEMATI